MANQLRSPTAAQRERLVYMLMLRQIEAKSIALKAAYMRLEKAVLSENTGSPATLILDWLEAELNILRCEGADTSEVGPTLISQALALCGALKG